MSKEIKFDTNEDILFQIAMIIYERHNSSIASINDNLGDMFSYKDLEDAKKYELEDEKHLLELAVKQLQQENQQLKSQLEHKEELIKEIRRNVENNAFEVYTKEYGNIEVVEANIILETKIRRNQ